MSAQLAPLGGIDRIAGLDVEHRAVVHLRHRDLIQERLGIADKTDLQMVIARFDQFRGHHEAKILPSDQGRE